jgi:DNA-directed RNA polymerase alpha subunit
MKRDIESTRRLLQALVGLSINIDEIIRTLNTIRPATTGLAGEGDRVEINAFLQLVDDEMRDLQRARKGIKKIRFIGETIVWSSQTISPHLDRPVDDLELSDSAAKCIPSGVKTIGQLCQRSSSELVPSSKQIKNEIKDTLRILFGLVLRPKG